jgi:hypothetical protein
VYSKKTRTSFLSCCVAESRLAIQKVMAYNESVGWQLFSEGFQRLKYSDPEICRLSKRVMAVAESSKSKPLASDAAEQDAGLKPSEKLVQDLSTELCVKLMQLTEPNIEPNVPKTRGLADCRNVNVLHVNPDAETLALRKPDLVLYNADLLSLAVTLPSDLATTATSSAFIPKSTMAAATPATPATPATSMATTTHATTATPTASSKEPLIIPTKQVCDGKLQDQNKLLFMPDQREKIATCMVGVIEFKATADTMNKPFSNATLAQIIQYLLIIKSRNPFRRHVFGMLMCSTHVQVVCVSDSDTSSKHGVKIEYGKHFPLLANPKMDENTANFSHTDGIVCLAGFLLSNDATMGYGKLPDPDYAQFHQLDSARPGASASYIGYAVPTGCTFEAQESPRRGSFLRRTHILKKFRRDSEPPTQEELADVIINVDQSTGRVHDEQAYASVCVFIMQSETSYPQLTDWLREVAVLLRLREKLGPGPFTEANPQLFPTLRKFGVHDGQGWLILNEACEDITDLEQTDMDQLNLIPVRLREAGVIDRDIRPANIMRCCKTRHIMKIDFGFAVVVESSSGMTQPLPLCGTIRFASSKLIGQLQHYVNTEHQPLSTFRYCYSFDDVDASVQASICYFCHRGLFEKHMPHIEQIRDWHIKDLVKARKLLGNLMEASQQVCARGIIMFKSVYTTLGETAIMFVQPAFCNSHQVVC